MTQEAIARLEKRASEIENHVKQRWGSDEEGRKWWPDAVQHAADLREVIAALKPPEFGVWVGHNGSRQPVADSDVVDIEFDNGRVAMGSRADEWEWDWTLSAPTIVKYRRVAP